MDVLYELLRSSPPREQVQAVLLEWGVEQLCCLLLTPSFGDEARERVFRVRTTELTRFLFLFFYYHFLILVKVSLWDQHGQNISLLFQVLYKILKSEKVSERNKQRIKLKDFGYLGLVCFLKDVPVTMTTVRCLYEQVLATGNTKKQNTKKLFVVLEIVFRQLINFKNVGE